ncbi:MAG: DUF1501 domain-containing protein [Verrucomicrobia bacterium]|nr:DUF1501 domain-containing protein [Verrucomicrobiota bacterium]
MTNASANEFRFNRRSFLGWAGGGLGYLALSHLLALERAAALARPPGAAAHPLAPKPPHFTPRAKAVICLFQHGGPSQMDLFDPKPELNKRDGQDYPGQDLEIHFDKQAGKLLRSPFQFLERGQSGMQMSELLPHTASIADELTLVRSMVTDSVDHESALRIIHTGKFQAGRPAWGSWVIYGLGTERQDLPAYVVLSDPGGLPIDGIRNWSSGWLPAIYQGTQVRSSESPIFNLATPADVPGSARANQLGFLERLNQIHLREHPENSELQARINNYELAARMQTSVTDALDLSRESAQTRKLYGLEHPNAATANYAKRCLMARRLVEQGVRFVQIYLQGQPWDTHDKNAERLKNLCLLTDQPSAALVLDLKQRGLLDSTIVLWTGEFGRLPISQGKDGRDHNRHGFSLWIAGGGFKKGHVHGATDDFGYKAAKDAVRVYDLHATLLHALGLDHNRLTYPHEGRADTLTDSVVSEARVIPELLA